MEKKAKGGKRGGERKGRVGKGREEKGGVGRKGGAEGEGGKGCVMTARGMDALGYLLTLSVLKYFPTLIYCTPSFPCIFQPLQLCK